MINCNQPINIATHLSVVFQYADSEFKSIEKCLASHLVLTVRDLVRLSGNDIMLLTGASRHHIVQLEELLLLHDMMLEMDFYVMEQHVDNANLDKVAKEAAVRRENELKELGCTCAHEQAQDELKSGTLKLIDHEITEWLSCGFEYIDEELQLRKQWKEKMEALRRDAVAKAALEAEKNKKRNFSIRSIKRYIIYMCHQHNV